MSPPKSNALDLSKIWVHKQNRNKNISRPQPIVAVDTETHNGNIFLIADSEGNFLDGFNITFEKVAEFLLKHEGKWIFFYNLGYDAESILKLIPKEVLNEYKSRRGLKRQLRFEYRRIKVHYIPKKKLVISKGNHSVRCYDIAQYYDNKPLIIAHQQNIGRPLSKEYLAMKEKRKVFTPFFYKRHKLKVRHYCIGDCKLTAELAEKWVDTFYATFGFYPRNWISSGYLAEKVLINREIEMPFFHDFEYPVQQLARAAFYGGRFELLQRGHIGECYLYDLNSAYPHALSLLPDLTKCNVVSGDTIHPKAEVGFFHIIADIDPSVKVAPFPFRTKDNRIIYPVDEFETYVTLDELNSVEGDTRIKYRILESVQFIPARGCGHPCKEFIEELYYRRLELKKCNNPLERAIKVVLNSTYGKTAQRTNNVMGNLFCPVVASYITGFVRARLYSFMREHNLERNVVAFATDSVVCRRKLPILNSDRLGEMKLDKSGTDGYFLSNGFYRINGVWKLRGVGYDYEKKVEVENVAVREGIDGQLYIGLATTKTIHIRSGIMYNKLNDVNKIVEYERKIDLNSDKKRQWTSDLTSLDDGSWCDSHALSMNVFGRILAKSTDFKWQDEEDERYKPESDL
jgi:hypothetical protein